MTKIILFSQNLVFSSLISFLRNNIFSEKYVFVTPHKLFDFEKKQILEIACDSTFYSFSELISDEIEQNIDIESYNEEARSLSNYYDLIKKKKNLEIIKAVINSHASFDGYVFSDDLGIDLQTWIDQGFKRVYGEYYYLESKEGKKKRNYFESIKAISNNTIFKAKSKKGEIILFYGSLNRVGYRLDLTFKKTKFENTKYIIQLILFKLFKWFPCNKKIIRLSSIHESVKWNFPKYKRFSVGIIQDGFLPENYSSRYLKFVGENVTYLTWDILGNLTFEFHNIKHKIIPFRKKVYLPYPKFSTKVKKILFSASGAGDWTALKNRSDDDNLVIVAGELAKRFPNIEIVFRCHPSWIHPNHQGVNSVNRVMEYIGSLGTKNFVLSGNIPENSLSNYKFSFSRNSFEKDLENVDLVVGEHSISMIDAAIKGIPFISVNVTGRRDFFSSITKLGFPHAESLDELVQFVNHFGNDECVNSFNKAVNSYNSMTDEE